MIIGDFSSPHLWLDSFHNSKSWLLCCHVINEIIATNLNKEINHNRYDRVFSIAFLAAS
jgi:hypothetical protein